MIVDSDPPTHTQGFCSARPSHLCAQPKCLQHHSVLSLCRLSSLTPSVWYSITCPESVGSQVLMQTPILNLQFPSLVPGYWSIYTHSSLRHFDLSHLESNLLSLMKHNSLLKNVWSAEPVQAWNSGNRVQRRSWSCAVGNVSVAMRDKEWFATGPASFSGATPLAFGL